MSAKPWDTLLRLCHSCGNISEGEKEVLRCSKCQKGFLPLTTVSELLHRAGHTQGAQILAQQNQGTPLYAPLYGLVVFW